MTFALVACWKCKEVDEKRKKNEWMNSDNANHLSLMLHIAYWSIEEQKRKKISERRPRKTRNWKEEVTSDVTISSPELCIPYLPVKSLSPPASNVLLKERCTCNVTEREGKGWREDKDNRRKKSEQKWGREGI